MRPRECGRVVLVSEKRKNICDTVAFHQLVLRVKVQLARIQLQWRLFHIIVILSVSEESRRMQTLCVEILRSSCGLPQNDGCIFKRGVLGGATP